MDDVLLRRREAGEYLLNHYRFSSPKSLAKYATVGGGPPFHKVGNYAIYKRSDLDAWAAERLAQPVNSTSEYKARRAAKRAPEEAA
jgi:hypothetical protein